MSGRLRAQRENPLQNDSCKGKYWAAWEDVSPHTAMNSIAALEPGDQLIAWWIHHECAGLAVLSLGVAARRFWRA